MRKLKANAVTDGAKYFRCLWVNSLDKFGDEARETDQTSLNKHPTDSPSRSISHKQASEDAHCYLPSVCSGNCNNRCTDMRSLNCSP